MSFSIRTEKALSCLSKIRSSAIASRVIANAALARIKKKKSTRRPSLQGQPGAIASQATTDFVVPCRTIQYLFQRAQRCFGRFYY